MMKDPLTFDNTYGFYDFLQHRLVDKLEDRYGIEQSSKWVGGNRKLKICKLSADILCKARPHGQ